MPEISPIGPFRFGSERADLQYFIITEHQEPFLGTAEDERPLTWVSLDEAVRLKDAIAGITLGQAVKARGPFLLISRQQGTNRDW
jgi:hypothetical protein